MLWLKTSLKIRSGLLSFLIVSVNFPAGLLFATIYVAQITVVKGSSLREIPSLNRPILSL